MSSSWLRRWTVPAVLSAIFLLLQAEGRGSAQKFYPDDPLWEDDDRAFDASKAAAAEVSEGFDFLVNSFGSPGDRSDIKAMNVNTLDEVPDSSWFTNRMGRRPMTIAEIERGPDIVSSLDITDWVIIRDKGAAGFQPGFRAYDARDTGEVKQWYQLEGDTEDYPELASGSEIIGTYMYHALGYNVVDTYIVTVDPKRLRIAPGASLRDGSGRRTFKQEDLDAILRLLAKNPDGTIRMTASRFIGGPGDVLEAFKYYGTRPDDPNDIYPHEHRRELRANRVFCAWLNHDDSRAVNTLDILHGEPGRRWIRHFMFDFGSLFGSSPDRRWSGVEYMYEGRPTWLAFATFGIWIQPWQFTRYRTDLPPAAMRFEGDRFDPAGWKPEYPNPAFDNMRPDDAFWGSRIVASFSDDVIRAIVRKAKYSDPRVTDYMTETLIKRRDKIARVWLNGVNPVVNFRLSADGALSFENAAVAARAATPARYYTLAWSRFDNVADRHEAVGIEETVNQPAGRLPASLAGSDFVSVRVTSSHADHPAWSQPVQVYFRRESGGWKTVGLERSSK
jgi:hypothetical protein